MALAISKEYTDLLRTARENLEAVDLMVGDTLNGKGVKETVSAEDEFVVETLLATLAQMLESCVGVASALHEFIHE